MNIPGTILRNVASNWVGIALHLVITFFLSPFVVNSLGSLYYGIWALTMQFTGYLYVLDFGIRDSIIRYTARYRGLRQPEKFNRLLTVSLAIYAPIAICGLVVTAIGTVGFPYWFNIEPAYVHESRVALALVGVTIAQGFVFNAFTGVLQGLQRFDLVNLVGVTGGILRAILVVIALTNGYGIIGLSWVQFGLAAAGNLVTMWLALRLLRQEGLPFRLAWVGGRRGRALARRVVGYSTYVFINNIGQKIILGTDAVIVGVFLPVASVTYYAIAGNLIGLLRGLVSATIWVLMPLVSHYAALRQMDEVRALLIRASKTALLVALPLCAGFMLVGREFIGLWMGEEFAPAAGQVLFILAIAEVASAPHHAMSAVLFGLNRHRAMAFLRIAEAAANLVLSIVLVRHFGLAGVALGTTIPHLLVMVLVLPVLVCKVVDLPLGTFFARAYLGPFVAILPFVGGVAFVRSMWPPENLLSFFVAMGAMTIPYVLSVLVFALTAEERAVVGAYVRRLSAGSNSV